MNYRHAYHAGNFADVLKHAVLALVLEHMKAKPASFRVIDTHAGIGLYDLAGAQALKTGEWRDGIGRILGHPGLGGEAGRLLEPYLGVVRGFNPEGTLARYPGSPLVARRLMRRGDPLIVNELHPEDNAALAVAMRGEPDTKVMQLDAWTALKSLLPPRERRGVVLIDPPFEQPGELERLAQGLAAAARRFATGVFVLWYPIKDLPPIRRFEAALAGLGLPKLTRIELLIRKPVSGEALNGCGLVLLNAPYRTGQQMQTLLPPLAALLAQAPGGSARIGALGG